MPSIELTLKPEDDRVVTLDVTDQHGEKYHIGIEFLNHHFGTDEVQVNVYKQHNTVNQYGLNNIDQPNRICHGGTPLTKRGEHRGGIWFEFHAIGQEGIEGYLPPVKTKS